MMFFILHALFFSIYRFYSNYVENWATRNNFALKSAYKKLQKIKRISDLPTLIFFDMLVETKVIFLSLIPCLV